MDASNFVQLALAAHPFMASRALAASAGGKCRLLSEVLGPATRSGRVRGEGRSAPSHALCSPAMRSEEVRAEAVCSRALSVLRVLRAVVGEYRSEQQLAPFSLRPAPCRTGPGRRSPPGAVQQRRWALQNPDGQPGPVEQGDAQLVRVVPRRVGDTVRALPCEASASAQAPHGAYGPVLMALSVPSACSPAPYLATRRTGRERRTVDTAAGDLREIVEPALPVAQHRLCEGARERPPQVEHAARAIEPPQPRIARTGSEEHRIVPQVMGEPDRAQPGWRRGAAPDGPRVPASTKRVGLAGFGDAQHGSEAVGAQPERRERGHAAQCGILR